jgi:hypothetical protein
MTVIEPERQASKTADLILLGGVDFFNGEHLRASGGRIIYIKKGMLVDACPPTSRMGSLVFRQT